MKKLILATSLLAALAAALYKSMEEGVLETPWNKTPSVKPEDDTKQVPELELLTSYAKTIHIHPYDVLKTYELTYQVAESEARTIAEEIRNKLKSLNQQLSEVGITMNCTLHQSEHLNNHKLLILTITLDASTSDKKAYHNPAVFKILDEFAQSLCVERLYESELLQTIMEKNCKTHEEQK